jgi:hypothetical protein
MKNIFSLKMDLISKKNNAIEIFVRNDESVFEDITVCKKYAKYLSINCEYFAYIALEKNNIKYNPDVSDSYKKLNSIFFEHTLTMMIIEYPHKLTNIPLLHKAAMIICNISLDSFIFSFFAGHYINDERDYIDFLSLMGNTDHGIYVKKLKDLEFCWDIINYGDNNDIEYVRNMKTYIYPIDRTIYDNIVKLTNEIENVNIKPVFNTGVISLHEYNLYRMIHLSTKEVNSKGIQFILENIKNNNYSIEMGLRNINSYKIDKKYTIKQNKDILDIIVQFIQ